MDKERAQVIDAVGVVGMLVCIEYRVEPIDAGVDKLLAQVGRRIDQHTGNAGPAATLDQERRAAALVLRIIGIADAPAERRTRHAAGGATAEDRDFQCHVVRR